MKIGYIQTHPIFGDKEANFQAIKEIVGDAKADLLVLPELFATGYAFQSREEVVSMAEDLTGETAAFLKLLSQKTGATVVAGFVEKENDSLYNSALVVKGDSIIDTYRKLHLFNKEKNWFTPGNKPLNVYDIEGVKIGVMICFDWMFPEVTRTLALRGAQIIAHPCNLVMPYCQRAMVTRCLENRIFAVTANRIGNEKRGEDDFTFTGGSQITAINGDILSSAPINEPALVIVEIDPTRANNKMVNQFNDVLGDRRSDFYL